MDEKASLGRTLKLFLVDGTAQGLITAEIMNWTGHVITGPRSKLAELIRRADSRRTGVYMLVGPADTESSDLDVYIGETDEVAQRLQSHNRNREYWERFCLVTSKDGNLTKGHVKYLESRLIDIATRGGRCKISNLTAPMYANLPEADRADMEFFIAQIQTLMPILGLDFLKPAPHVKSIISISSTEVGASQQASVASPVFVISKERSAIQARGQEYEGEFVVFKDSLARAEWGGTETSSYKPLFNRLIETGVLVKTPDGQHTQFTRDYAFGAPSPAAAVVLGRNANGRTNWVNPVTGQTYAAWQESLVAVAITGAVSQASDALMATSPPDQNG